VRLKGEQFSNLPRVKSVLTKHLNRDRKFLLTVS
jgi:hypothetical protein